MAAESDPALREMAGHPNVPPSSRDRAKFLRLPFNRPLGLIALALLMCGGVLAAAPAWGPALLGEDLAYGTVPIVGVLIALPAFIFVCVGVRCCRCGYKLFWHAIARQKHPKGLTWFLTADACPACGYSTSALASGQSRPAE